MKPTAASSAVTCLCLLALAGVAEEPDRSVDELITELKSTKLPARRDAAYALDQLGVKAKPAVAALADALADGDQQVWSRAASALAGIGPDAAPAIPQLLVGLGAAGQRGYRFGFALSRIGAPALPTLITSLQSDQPPLRIGAARALGMMGAVAAPAAPPLITALADPDASVSQQASRALGRIGAPAVALLSEALSSEHAAVRRGAAQALEQVGPPARPAAAPLGKVSGDSDPAVRASALLALAALGPPVESALPQLVGGLSDVDPDVRTAALLGLLRTRPASQQATPELIRLLSHERADVVLTATRALARLGPVPGEAIPLLAAALKRVETEPQDPTFRRVFARIGGPATAALVELLQDDSSRVKMAACACLGTLGLRAVAARSALQKLLQTEDKAVAEAAQAALQQMEERPPSP
ncbi:MAG: hypothetical protein CMJ59_12600 [Planctomycetaceae bacterium]|nr:hypothetical protein [Planctomycetaceae bacterium]